MAKREGKGSGKPFKGEAIPKLKQLDIAPKKGRPTTYTDELAKEFCKRIAMGNSLRRVCAAADMPDLTTILDWEIKNEEFSKQYTRAREERAEAYVEEIFDIADDSSNDYMEDQYMKGKTPGYQLNGENIQRSKLRVDARKWYASKMKPKRYGDKLDVTSEGEKLEGLVIIKNADDKPQ